MDRAFRRLVHRLHAAELEHLRRVVAEQQAEIERLQQETEHLQREASWADDRAQMFQDALHAMSADTDTSICLTPEGALVALAPA
ncbi:hypothetical protein [Leptothrix discophora]|uniref:Uncharacterized protein n=1 Tax=Leptothrix discophora TaxID=89 RepID=A0ABT9G1U0_LEPDI|nr:hypothetical protein [Leptothrix discophora]MDP4300371.1 hypothetical protein [Leptothrix discophora]